MSHPQKITTLVACAAATFGLAACGGSDGGGDEGQIREVIEQALTTQDPANCEETASDNFIQKFYNGSVEACQADVEGGETADEVEVTGIEINGDAATTEVSVTGGENDGRTSTIKLVNQTGDWLIDDFSLSGANQLTDLFFESIRQNAISQGLSKPQADCVVEGLRDTITSEELDALQAGDRPGSVSKKASAAGTACKKQ